MEEEEEVVKNLMSDIHAGFVQRRLPDGGFKVIDPLGRPTFPAGSDH